MLRTNPDSELNIKRIDSRKKKKSGGGTHGFQVYFNRNYVEYTRLFSDGINGGKEAARLEARNFRSILEQAIPPSRAGAGRTGPSQSNTGHMDKRQLQLHRCRSANRNRIDQVRGQSGDSWHVRKCQVATAVSGQRQEIGGWCRCVCNAPIVSPKYRPLLRP